MTNRPKRIGTAAESAVVRAARAHGFGAAERRALHGSADLGDVLLCPGVILEVKGGAAAHHPSDAQLEAWLAETETERRNAGAHIGLLVTQRAGVGAPNAARWWAWQRYSDFAWAVGRARRDLRDVPVRLPLWAALTLLRIRGWGDPIEEENGDE